MTPVSKTKFFSNLLKPRRPPRRRSSAASAAPSKLNVDEPLQHQLQHRSCFPFSTSAASPTFGRRLQHRHRLQPHQQRLQHLVNGISTVDTSTTSSIRVRTEQEPRTRLCFIDGCLGRTLDPTACGIWRKGGFWRQHNHPQSWVSRI